MVASDPEEPRQRQEPLTRIEREVLEILERADSERPPVTELVKWKALNRRRRSQQQLRQVLHRIGAFATPGVLLLAGVVLSLISVFALDSSTLHGKIVSIAAILLIIVPFGMAFRRPPTAQQVKRWRGQDIVLSDRPESPLTLVKRWWKNRNRVP